MATYTIEINERTNKGKALRTFLECEEVVRLKPVAESDMLPQEIMTGLLEAKKIKEGKLPKRTVAQILDGK